MAALEAEAEKRLDQLEARLGFRFKQRELLREAMTHTSWINERGVAGRDNERLEYLGDAVLELVAGEYLFKRFPGYDEGQLTQIRSSLVSTVALARLGEELTLGETLRLGKGAAKSGARRLTSLHANAFEALVGATFLDQGYRRAGRIFLSRIGDLSAWTDPNFKGRLQAVAQEKLGGPPQYRTAPVGQDARSRQYLSQVSVEGHGMLGEGRGGTKQAAEQAAARLALEKLMAPEPKRRRGRSAAVPTREMEPPPAEPAPPPSTLAAVPPAGDEAPQPRRKRRRSRSRSAVELPAEPTAVQPDGLEPQVAQVPPQGATVAPSEAAVSLAGDEAPQPRRKRRRSRSRSAVELAAEPTAVQPGGLEPPATQVPPQGATVAPSEAAVPVAGDDAPPPRRKRRRSRSRSAVEALAAEPDAVPPAMAGGGAGAEVEASVEEAAAGRRRRRRSRARSVVAPAAPSEPGAGMEEDGPPPATDSRTAEAAPSRRRSRRSPGAPTSGPALGEPPASAPDAAQLGPPSGSDAEAQELAARPEGPASPRRTRRGHRGGRRRTKVVVSGPE